MIKPDIGVTIRVLLRGNALFILVKNYDYKRIQHILF